MMPKMASIATTQILGSFSSAVSQNEGFSSGEVQLECENHPKTRSCRRTDPGGPFAGWRFNGHLRCSADHMVPMLRSCLGPVPVGRMGLVITCHRLQTSKLRLGIESIEDV